VWSTLTISMLGLSLGVPVPLVRACRLVRMVPSSLWAAASRQDGQEAEVDLSGLDLKKLRKLVSLVR
jgi:hypothetical protein